MRTSSSSNKSESVRKDGDIRSVYSALDLGTFLRDEKIKNTIDKANSTLMLDDRIVMIVAGIHDAFMKSKKTIPNKQLGDGYRRQVSAASTYIAVEMEYVRTGNETLIRAIDEIAEAYNTPKNLIFRTADEIRRSQKMQGHTIDGVVYAKRSVDIVVGLLVKAKILDVDKVKPYAAEAKELLDKMKKAGKDFSIGSKGSAASALGYVAEKHGNYIPLTALTFACGASSSVSFNKTYTDFKKCIPK